MERTFETTIAGEPASSRLCKAKPGRREASKPRRGCLSPMTKKQRPGRGSICRVSPMATATAQERWRYCRCLRPAAHDDGQEQPQYCPEDVERQRPRLSARACACEPHIRAGNLRPTVRASGISRKIPRPHPRATVTDRFNVPRDHLESCDIFTSNVVGTGCVATLLTKLA